MSKEFLYPSLVTILSLILYMVVGVLVGRARVKYNVLAPQTTGNPDFERVLRVQQNTGEQLLNYLPALWIFSITVSPIWGAALGGVWIVGRIVYAIGYTKAANKRGPGFAITALATMALLIGSLIGIVQQLIKTM
jgi:uncharacterized membrane protein YecN with MAPEG domain